MSAPKWWQDKHAVTVREQRGRAERLDPGVPCARIKRMVPCACGGLKERMARQCRRCASRRAGPRNPNWKGGRVVASNGYVLLRMPGHHLADVRGYVYEHRLVAEQILGRRLKPGEISHHKNGFKADNRPENIEVVESQHHHRVAHRTVGFTRRLPGEQNRIIECACGCGHDLPKFDSSGRPRKFISGHNTRSR